MLVGHIIKNDPERSKLAKLQEDVSMEPHDQRLFHQVTRWLFQRRRDVCNKAVTSFPQMIAALELPRAPE